MGETISDKLVITKILMSLPTDYKHFVSAWESAPDDKQTFDNLMARLLVEEERLKEKNEDPTPSSSAFVVKKQKPIKCFKCGKNGHYQSACKTDKNNSVDNINNNSCFYCGKFGHFKAQCKFRKNKNNNKFNSGSSKSNAFMVSNSSYELHQSMWLVDSGASEHMCRDRALFTSYSSVLQKSVVVGNGAVISALGSGQVAAQVFDGTNWIDTTIDNVLYVPELKTNLFSMNRATERGMS